MTQRPNRPRGISLIAPLLLFFFVSAIGNLFVSRSMGSEDIFPAGSPFAHFAAAVSGPYFPPLVILYGLAALIAAVGMWRMRPWMPVAFLVWSITAVVHGTFFLFAFPKELLWGGKSAAATFVLGTAVALWLTYRYVRRAASEVDVLTIADRA
jgi:hypothetical protein